VLERERERERERHTHTHRGLKKASSVPEVSAGALTPSPDSVVEKTS
jgi:hypothetical protein